MFEIRTGTKETPIETLTNILNSKIFGKLYSLPVQLLFKIC